MSSAQGKERKLTPFKGESLEDTWSSRSSSFNKGSRKLQSHDGDNAASSEGGTNDVNGVVFGECPCEHNNWDNVRVRKAVVTLACRDCKAKWKAPHPIEPKCPDFYAGNCVLAASCPLLHIHRNKARKEDVEKPRDPLVFAAAKAVLQSQPPGTAPSTVLPLIHSEMQRLRFNTPNEPVRAHTAERRNPSFRSQEVVNVPPAPVGGPRPGSPKYPASPKFAEGKSAPPAYAMMPSTVLPMPIESHVDSHVVHHAMAQPAPAGWIYAQAPNQVWQLAPQQDLNAQAIPVQVPAGQCVFLVQWPPQQQPQWN